MKGDIEIVEHLIDSMLKAADELEKATARNNIESTAKIKKQISEINLHLAEELQ